MLKALIDFKCHFPNTPVVWLTKRDLLRLDLDDAAKRKAFHAERGIDVSRDITWKYLRELEIVLIYNEPIFRWACGRETNEFGDGCPEHKLACGVMTR